MDDPLETLRNFGNSQEAAIAKGILNDHGIPAFTQGDSSATTMSYFGSAIGGVNLQVPASLHEKAAEILDEQLESGEDVPKWNCPECGAVVDAGFAVCWDCSTPYSERDAADAEWDAGPPAAEPEPDEVVEFPEDEKVGRAWRAAIIGVLLFPFALYAVRVLEGMDRDGISDRGRRIETRTQLLAYGSLTMHFLFLANQFGGCVPPLFD